MNDNDSTLQRLKRLVKLSQKAADEAKAMMVAAGDEPDDAHTKHYINCNAVRLNVEELVKQLGYDEGKAWTE